MKKKKNLSKIICITGLSGSRKSTLSSSIYKKLITKKYKVKKINTDKLSVQSSVKKILMLTGISR